MSPHRLLEPRTSHEDRMNSGLETIDHEEIRHRGRTIFNVAGLLGEQQALDALLGVEMHRNRLIALSTSRFPKRQRVRAQTRWSRYRSTNWAQVDSIRQRRLPSMALRCGPRRRLVLERPQFGGRRKWVVR